MKKIIILYILFITSCSISEDKKVYKSFQDYKTSILDENGERAYELIDNNTRIYYSTMLEYSKSLKITDLENLKRRDQLMIISIRHRTSEEELKRFTGKDLFIWAVNNGMIGKASVEKLDVKGIKVVGDLAEGIYYVNGQNTFTPLKFVKIDNSWKVDLTSTFDFIEYKLMILYNKAKSGNNMYERDFINNLVEIGSGKKVDPKIWYKTIE